VVASVSRIDEIIGLFCERALQKRQYSAKETCNLIDPTDRSHPILPDLKSLAGQHKGQNAQDIVTAQIAKLKYRFKGTEAHEKCNRILSMTPDQIREEDTHEVEQFDTSRKDSHIKAFENQALGLQRVIQDMTDKFAYM